MEPRRNLEFLLGATMFLAIIFLLFELYWLLLFPALLIISGLFSERFTIVFVNAFRRSGSFVSGILSKLF